MSRYRLAALTGVGFFVLVVISIVVQGETPSADDRPLEVVKFYRDNDTEVVISAVLSALAATLLVIYSAYLRDLLRRAEGERHLLSQVMFAGAIIIAVGAAIDTTILLALADTADDVDPVAIQSLNALYNNDYVPFALGSQLFLIGAGLSVVRRGLLPKWLGWAAIVLAVIALTPIGFVAFLGWGLWVLVTSVILALREKPAGATQA